MNILLLDNYDSFTHNLSQMIEENAHLQLDIIKNDEIDIKNIAHYDGIVLSPGPGLPQDAGIMPQIIEKYHKNKPILGVCLGHQAIAQSFGGELLNLDTVFHGVASCTEIVDTENIIFKNISNNFQAGRYHSWAVSRKNFPKELIISAYSSEGDIMAIRHRKLPIFGVQFHPESYLTPEGNKMIANFLNLVNEISCKP